VKSTTQFKSLAKIYTKVRFGKAHPKEHSGKRIRCLTKPNISSIRYFKNYYLYLSREQAAFRRRLDAEVVFNLDHYRGNREAQVTKYVSEIQKILDDRRQKEESLLKAKQALQKLNAEIQNGKDRITALETTIASPPANVEGKERERKIIGKLLSAFDYTPEQEKERQKKLLGKLENDARTAIVDIATKKELLLQCIFRQDEVEKKVNLLFKRCMHA
jgi:hypothetical protein